ncbi:MAG: hypothetical protein FJ403_09405 [Verrucomicrobia bacterium]|nr:hypothetical protein [Verrucomicrobiota bacterium]
MNSKIVAILLVVICLGLAGGLAYRHLNAKKEKEADAALIQDLTKFTNDLTLKLEEQKLVNQSLERDLDTKTQELKSYSNNLASVSANLEKVQIEAKAAADAAKAEALKREEKIASLEAERDDLSKKMTELTSSISGLETRIAETQRRLDASEGDREFLLKELKRMQAEKAELERQFNDLALVREQVRRLRDELSLARRLEWIRKGLWGAPMKGAERLAKGFTPAGAKTNYNLNVELRRDGSVTITTNNPASGTTNAGAATNAPPR